MCTLATDGTIHPCGALWPEGSHEAAWHPHVNCPVCAATHDATHQELTMWLVQHAGRNSWQDLATKLMKDFRVLRKETT